MCPGGQVIAAASETGCVVTNGMSLFARAQANANSAVLVGVDPSDFPEQGPLGGMLWQQQIEQLAFAAGHHGYRAPAQRVGSFLHESEKHKPGASHNHLQPTYRPGVVWTELDTVLPPPVSNALREALPVFNQRLPGFAAPNAILTGPETEAHRRCVFCATRHYNQPSAAYTRVVRAQGMLAALCRRLSMACAALKPSYSLILIKSL
jgi:uncharacterized protein